jgi:hypothetical protein|tara:strand:- start:5623 stop:5772 length:150 start_codon:yes stop_codon:yes gene_type:complete
MSATFVIERNKLEGLNKNWDENQDENQDEKKRALTALLNGVTSVFNDRE